MCWQRACNFPAPASRLQLPPDASGSRAESVMSRLISKPVTPGWEAEASHLVTPTRDCCVGSVTLGREVVESLLRHAIPTFPSSILHVAESGQCDAGAVQILSTGTRGREWSSGSRSQYDITGSPQGVMSIQFDGSFPGQASARPLIVWLSRGQGELTLSGPSIVTGPTVSRG